MHTVTSSTATPLFYDRLLGAGIINTFIIMAVKAKFRCNSVTDFGGQKQAQFTAVYSQTGENADFAQATPSGDLKINIDSGVPASNFFKPGNSYYLTFEEAAN